MYSGLLPVPMDNMYQGGGLSGDDPRIRHLVVVVRLRLVWKALESRDAEHRPLLGEGAPSRRHDYLRSRWALQFLFDFPLNLCELSLPLEECGLRRLCGIFIHKMRGSSGLVGLFQ